MTALNLILIVAGTTLAVGLLAVFAWLIYSWYFDRVERRLAERKGLYRELVSELATRDRALLHPTIHQISTLYDLDALEAVLEEQARTSSDRPGWLLEVYDELGLVDKYIDMLRSAPKWRDRAFAAELLGRVGGAKAVPALLETAMATRTEDSDVREVALRALARIADPRAVEPLIRALGTAEVWLAPRIADILTRHGDSVVDPLIAVLQEEGHRPAWAWAANVLGEVRAHRAFPALVRLLRDPEDEVRGKAATALGRLGDPRAVGYLLDQLLSDPAPFVRVRIASSLGQFGGPLVIDRLVRALGDSAWWVRMRSVEALEQIGAVAEGPLLVALDDIDPEIRLRAAVALERLGVPNNLVRMIESGDHLPEANETLVKFATTGAREFLGELAQHHSSQVRSAVVTAIQRAGRRDLADDLIQIAIDDSEPGLRAQAISTLRSLGIREALPAALTGLADQDHRVRAASVELLGRFGGPDVAGLLCSQTTDTDPAVRTAALQALGTFGTLPAEVDLARLLRDPDPTVRAAAVSAAADARLNELVPSLVELLKDAEPEVRRSTAMALAAMGNAGVVPALFRAFPDPVNGVSEAIAVAVSRLDPSALGDLAEALVESPDAASKLTLIQALRSSRADALPALHRLRADASPKVRAAALNSIGRLGLSGENGPAVEAMNDGLQDPEELVRAAAVDISVRIVGENGGSFLLGLLENDPSPLVRERAALAMALLKVSGGEGAVIASARRAEPPNVRAAAILAAGAFDPQSMVARLLEMPDQGTVRKILRHRLRSDPRFRLLGMKLSGARHLELRALAQGSDADAQASLAQGAKSLLDAGERIRLIGSLRAFRGEQSSDTLLRMVREDPAPEVRTAALTSLGDLLGPDELLTIATRALGDPSALVRRAAVELFPKVNPERSMSGLIEGLQVDDDPAVLAAAAGVAEEHFDLFAQAASAIPVDGDRAVLVTRVARHMVHPDLPDLLPSFARSASPDVRAALADLWMNRPDTVDHASLEGLTKDPVVSIRRTAAGAALAAERYDLLHDMTQDPEPSVRRKVALVLGGAAPVREDGLATLDRLSADLDMTVRAAAYVARLLLGMPLPLPPELDSQVAAQAVRESADLEALRQAARTSSSEEQRLGAALALALLQDDVAREVARTDPEPTIRHRVAGALELSA